MKKSPRGVFERMLTEDDVLGQIRSLLELNGARVHRVVERIPWGRKTSEAGIPDLFGWFPERAECFFIEVKRPGGKLRPAQAAWIKTAQEDGVICFMADSVESMVEQFSQRGISIKGLQ